MGNRSNIEYLERVEMHRKQYKKYISDSKNRNCLFADHTELKKKKIPKKELNYSMSYKKIFELENMKNLDDFIPK